MTKEQGEAILAYIDAAIAAEHEQHAAVQHGAPTEPASAAEEKRLNARMEFVGLLP